MRKFSFFKEKVEKPEPKKPILLGTVPQDKLEEFWKLYCASKGGGADGPYDPNFELHKYYLWKFLYNLFDHDPTSETDSKDPMAVWHNHRIVINGSFLVEVWEVFKD